MYTIISDEAKMMFSSYMECKTGNGTEASEGFYFVYFRVANQSGYTKIIKK